MKVEELEDLEKVARDCENYDIEELDAVIQRLKIKSPDGNELGGATKFNLMFETQIGPTGGVKAYLRPETAQGQFVNFRKLLEFNGGKLPFGSATIGLGFRNEIAPRSGLLRVREFSMAEIEYFCDPENKKHKKFKYVKDAILPLLTKENLKEGKGVINDLTLEQAVELKVIDNETLAYFMYRTFAFLITVGINPNAVRFRQHGDKELAHYSSDCWDAEVETSYGWIEVVGHADRKCFDLNAHMNATGVELMASRPLTTPIIDEYVRVQLNKVKNIFFKHF